MLWKGHEDWERLETISFTDSIIRDLKPEVPDSKAKGHKLQTCGVANEKTGKLSIFILD